LQLWRPIYAAALLQVPEKLMLSANTALSSKHCGKLVKQAELSEWQVRMVACF
jgi:hypothetical protein